jgi:hypothetical protein
MIEMPITSSDTDEAKAAANARQDYAEKNEYKSHGDEVVPRDKERRNHIVGCLGELKCAQHFGLNFDPSIGVITSIDCKIIEVRTRRIETGRDLALRPNDKWRLPFVLVWLNRERMLATIVGWLCGWEGHQRAMLAKQEAGRDVWWQPLTGAWFIPPPYHSIQSLEDWIDAGHPEHWAPDGYRGVVP